MAELPIAQFLKERLTEYDPKFELRKGTGFEQLFFKPIEFILQPLRDEANSLFIAQSFLRILQQDDPNAFDEESVDALGSNVFVTRRQSGLSGGVGRVYFNEPVSREYPSNGAIFNGTGGQTYSNPAPFKITAAEMSAQIEDGLYFFDIPLQSQNPGIDQDLSVDELISITGDIDVVSVTNKLKFEGGVDKEKNIDYINRIQASIGVRDLSVSKGFNGILFDNFLSFLRETQPIGFGDKEMMRDIVFNTHIGGKVDGYCKTSSITVSSKDFVGLLIDTTRQTRVTQNIQMIALNENQLSEKSIDRSGGLVPIVKEIKDLVAAEFISSVFSAPPTLFDLSITQHVRIGIDGLIKNVRIAGAVPSVTNRNEIINLINASFGRNVASVSGNFIKIKSTVAGLSSQVVMDVPTIGSSALQTVFGLLNINAPYVFNGDGPVTFEEGIHYQMNDGDGTIQRILGSSILPTQVTGNSIALSDAFNDPTTNIFLNVQVRDVVTISSGPDIGDYRVKEKISNNQLILDTELTTTLGSIQYSIKRTGIKSSEVVYIEFHYNPISIDIGKLVKLDEDGAVRGIRPGREEFTITDLPFLRIVSIEVIDPLTLESTGEILKGTAGYGMGGYGEGPYGVGSDAQYRLIVNSATERFSMFEDSYIVISSGLSARSLRVNYEYVPELEEVHNFSRSDFERVLDGDTLIKHFLPAYVVGTIQYSVDPTDISVPTNESVQEVVRNYISTLKAGESLDFSDLIQLITKTVDPFFRFGSFVKPFTLNAVIHNTDGTISTTTSNQALTIPTLDPFPRNTSRPLSPRIAHWLAQDDLILERI